MENLKIQIKIEDNDNLKEAHDLLLKLGFSTYNEESFDVWMDHKKPIWLKTNCFDENLNKIDWSNLSECDHFKETTIQDLRDMVTLKRNNQTIASAVESLYDQIVSVEEFRQGQKEELGKKFDSSKPRMSLLPKGAVNAVIRVLEFGAKKYTIIDFHDTIIIGKTIEERLWSSTRNVSSAESTKESSLKVAVQNATVRSTIKYLHALAVEKKNLSQQKMGDVVLATSLSDLPSVLWNLKLDKNINKLTEAHMSSENKNANVIANDVVIPNTENNNAKILNNETLRDTDLPYKSMNIFVSEGALSAEVQNVHTLTTTIAQGSSVTSFVVSAIKLLDCYKTLLILLEHYYSISINISELGEVKRGEGNWKHVPDAKTRYYDAMQRHIDAWWNGEQKDPETGEHHLAHAICCGMFLWWFDDMDTKVMAGQGFAAKFVRKGDVDIPEAILEAEKKPCHHQWVDGLDGGTMVCAHKCGAWK